MTVKIEWVDIDKQRPPECRIVLIKAYNPNGLHHIFTAYWEGGDIKDPAHWLSNFPTRGKRPGIPEGITVRYWSFFD